MVSRYREEIGREGATREAHRRTVQTAGRTAVFSGLTVAAAMAALVVMPQRFLYSMAVAGRLGRDPLRVIAILVVPSLLALLGTRSTRSRSAAGRRSPTTSDGWYRLARGRDAPSGRRRPGQLGLLPRLRGAAALDDADRGPAPKRCARAASYRRLPLPSKRTTPRDVTEAVTVTVDGGAGPASWPASSGASTRSTGSPRAAPSSPSRRRRLRQLRPRRTGAAERHPDAVQAIRDLPPPPGAKRGARLRQHGGFIDQKQSLIEHAPLVVAIVARPR
jgi:RND superfamily putative drug exporter